MPAAERERVGEAGRAWILAKRPYAKLAEDYMHLLKGMSNRQATDAKVEKARSRAIDVA